MVGYYRYANVFVCCCATSWYLYREYPSGTPETLPRLKRLFTGRHSSHRIQRSLSLRVHSSTKSQPASSGVRSFATKSFSGADKLRVERPVQDRAAAVSTTKRYVNTITSSVSYLVLAHRSVSVSDAPAVNGRLLHETGQTLDEPPYW